MEYLLKNNYTAYYGLAVCTEPNIVIHTNETYFEIEDTASREIVIHTTLGQGMARFSNPNRLVITITNYDKFLTSLPNHFQKGRKRCDIIVSDAVRYFILGEIKDTPNIRQHRKYAKRQLFDTLTTLMAVPEIHTLLSSRIVKRCCYFNKQTNSPGIITATTAFNRLSTFFQDSFQMKHAEIETLDFEYWEYLGSQTLSLS